MRGATVRWIRARPVSAFFLLAIGVCFTLLFPAVQPQTAFGDELLRERGRVP